MSQEEFLEIVQFIQQSRYRALKAVNAELINLYWNIGKYISCRLASAKWGNKKIEELSVYIQNNYPELKSFDRRGFYRMKQFYDTYASASLNFQEILQLSTNERTIIVASLRTQFEDIRSSLLTKLSWTHHRTIFSRCKSEEEMVFYMRASIENNYTVRELDRQISASLFERTMLSDHKLPHPLQSKSLNLVVPLKNSYVFEFLNLSENHNERELQQALVRKMKDFILELGKDFLFIGEEYKLSVGNSDFFIDLLFYHRGLQCLVAFELKADKFKPEYLGQLNFYLEALDRDVRKQNEKPSIGVLLCKDKDQEVVEYALSRTLSPTMVAEYKTQLPDKKLLQEKLHEIFENKDIEDLLN
jgi:predicted nuclease of restriction endonuclease-like (RecB) superfamily